MSAPALTVRAANARERLAIRAARWKGLPAWAADAGSLRVAVAGKREVLLGCAWEMDAGDAIQAGVAVSPEAYWKEEAAARLIGEIRADRAKPVCWSAWLNASHPQVALLEARGFVPGMRMMAYEIPIRLETRERMAAGVETGERRMRHAGLGWGDLSEARAVEAVRRVTLEENLMSGAEFDFLYRAGEIDLKTSTVIWQGGQLAGLMVMMAREAFEVLLLVVRRDFRSTGLNALLIWETARKKLAVYPDADRIIFRGNPVDNPGSRRLCLRFGGHETTACVKLHLPAEELR